MRTRWQQLTGPATAKGVEDRAFWRYLALASLGEVGGQVEPVPDPIAALHDHHAMTAARWPTTMLAGTTHDVARSEDVRAVGLVLASAAEAWTRVVDERVETPSFPDIDLPMRWLALQTVATTPGLSAERLAAFLVKAAREADRRTSWVEPDEAYEQRLTALAHDVLVWPPVAELAASLDGPGRATALAMLAVRATAPGVPDVYQGTEGFRFLLVDPDNRRLPDLGELEELVAPGQRARRRRSVERAAQRVREGGRAAPVAGAAPPSARGLRTRRRLRPAGDRRRVDHRVRPDRWVG